MVRMQVNVHSWKATKLKVEDGAVQVVSTAGHDVPLNFGRTIVRSVRVGAEENGSVPNLMTVNRLLRGRRDPVPRETAALEERETA